MIIRLHRRQGAFSLVELLLTLVLILCLAAASVFTFTALYRSANLDEGNDRFQSLIRFAQAEAATTGRKVRLQFVAPQAEESSSEDRPELRKIKVTWESDMLNAPGVFQTYTNKSWSEDMVNELVGVEKVQSIQTSTTETPQTGTIASIAPAFSQGESDGLASMLTNDFPAVTFYPDGSCDSAQIVLASRNSEDARRIEVRLSGILGSVSTRTVSSEDALNNETADVEEEYDELFENSQPVSSSSSESSDDLSF